jgi:hypothetical protein
MRERDRLSIQAHREEIQSLEREEREARERPIREAEEQLRQTTIRLRGVMCERLLGKLKDPDRIMVDSRVTGITMSRADADKFNRTEFAKFKDEHPDIHWTQELLVNLGDYFHKNGLQIVTAEMISTLIERYREYALLPDPPQPDPEPEPEPQPDPAPKPEVFEGWDLDSGEPRTFTRREVDRMSADEYRRVFRIYKEHLGLPNLGPGARRQL